MNAEPTRKMKLVLPFAVTPLVLAGALVIGWGTAAGAQQLPPASQVQELLKNPQVAELLRDRLKQSGMTADQVRARLKSAGYPDTLLNSFLGGGGDAEITAMELEAMQVLGVAPMAQPSQPVDTGLVAGTGNRISPQDYAAGNYVFGTDVFMRGDAAFLPLLAGPVPPDYRLGPGDEIVLILTGDVELAYTLPVTREGFILIPHVGQVFINTLSFQQAEDLLRSRLSRVYSGLKGGAGATTRMSISMSNVRVNQVYVLGEVFQPGAQQISALGTVLTSLYAAGGVTTNANLREIEVRRLGKIVDTLDLYDYLLQGDSRRDIRLEMGDVVFVPIRGRRARVTGAVKRPAIYEVRARETLSDLFKAAGGFRHDAAVRRVSVYRLLPPAARSNATPVRVVIDVPLATDPSAAAARQPAGGGAGLGGVIIPALGLEDGDSVVVDAVPPPGGEFFVVVRGMVQQPGIFPWHNGMTIRDAILLARGPVVGADLREAEVARMPQDRSSGQLATTMRVPLDSSYLYNRDSSGRYFGPPGVAFPQAGVPETELHPYDIVLILKQPEFDYQRTVLVVGQVRYPGAYSLRDKGERLADIIERAKGLTAQAYPQGIRFVRQVGNVGRVNVDLPRALKDPTSRYNIILQPGDSIEIPEYQPAVKVTGAVNSPGSVLWKEGERLEYYVNAAGGLSYKADKGRVSVRFANGEVRTRHRSLFHLSDPKPGPGSEVMIPEKDMTKGVNWIVLTSAISGIVTSLVALVVLLNQL